MESKKEWYSAKELSGLPGLPKSDRNIRIKAERQNWLSQPKVVGKGFEYHIDSLPIETQGFLKAQQIKKAATPIQKQMQVRVEADTEQEREKKIKIKAQNMQQFLCLSEDKQSKAYARQQVIEAYIAFIQPYIDAKNTTQGLSAFIQAYNNKSILNDADAHSAVPKIAKSSLYNWKQLYQEEGLLGLVDKYKSAQQSKIDSQPRLAEFIHALVTAKPHFLKQPKSVLESAHIKAEQYGWELPSIGSFKRWLNTYAKKHEVELAYITDPSKYTDKYRPLFQRMYPWLSGPNQVWEFDSTPTDVELNVNGKLKRHSVVAAIDVFTRRVLLIVSPTSNSEAICLLLRKCLLEWGIPEENSVMRTDNGSDYVSKRTTGIFNLLELEISKATAFSGWEKPFIERFFRTMSSTILEKAPGYIGHSVNDRQQIEAMKTFAERIGEGKKKAQQERLEMAMTPEELQEALDKYLKYDYNHIEHDKDGVTPFERYANSNYQKRNVGDPHILDLLLSFVGTATVARGKVRANNLHYTAPELQEVEWQRKQVKVFVNPKNAGEATLYPIDNWDTYVEAVDIDLVGLEVPNAEFQESRKQATKLLRQKNKISKQLQDEFGIETLYAEDLAQKQAKMGGLVTFENTTDHNNAAIQGLASAADKQQQGYSEKELDRMEQQRKVMTERKERQAEHESRLVRNDHEKAVMLTEESIVRKLTEKEQNWLETYRLNNVLQRTRLDKILKNAEQSTHGQVK